MSSPVYSFLRTAYRLIDEGLLARLSPQAQRTLKKGVLSLARRAFPRYISHSQVHSLIRVRPRPPAGALDRIPAWALEEALMLRRHTDPSLVVDTSAKPHVVQTNHAPGADAFRKLRDALSPRYDMVLFVPWLKPGGADLGVLHYCRALIAMGRRVAVVATEASESPWASRLPPGVDFLEIGDAIAGLDEQRGEPRAVITRALLECRPGAIHIIGSRSAWDAVSQNGAAIAQATRIYASLFCDDYDADGVPVGLAVQFLPSCARHLTAVLSDNAHYPARWHDRWGIDRAHFHRVPFPAPDPMPDVAAMADAPTPGPQGESEGSGERPRLLWAGRLDRQKRPDILIELARSLPEFDWHIYGAQVVPGHGVDMAPLRKLRNVSIMGAYSRFGDLLAGRYLAFVYTSQWDGLPNVLLEAARYLPIVAPAVGGIPELLKRERLVPSIDDIPGFVEAVRRLHADTALRQSWLEEQRRALDGHTQQRFMEHLGRVPGYFGAGDAGRWQEVG